MCAALIGTGLCASLAAAAPAPWATFVNETNTRLQAVPGLGVQDPEEKDFAFGDLNQDGWIDLVVARKQPWTNGGRKPNVLFMNENGVLVDRTQQFASASLAPDDQGFLTPTADRDVAIADVNNDGWLDVITATTLSGGQPTHISHPRVYINLGENGRGQWLGLQYNPALFPALAQVPNFCSVSAGDVTGDGFADLYFADYNSNLEDRLLINNGSGSFTDQTALRVSASMIQSGFGHSSTIADINGDGRNDLVKGSALGPTHIATSYNNAATTGFFPSNSFQVSSTGSTYFHSVGDLNADGRLDLIVSDDGNDHYHLNQGNGVNGHVNWTGNSFPNSGGFNGNSSAADLNNDGFSDVLISDVDVDIPGCGGMGKLYMNNGNAPNVTFAQNNANIPSGSMVGMHDMKAFDINNDGWLDLVLGRCSGIQIWINDPPCASTDLNCDGPIDGVDLGILLSQWGADGSADFNGDNVVDGIDLGILLAGWTL